MTRRRRLDGVLGYVHHSGRFDRSPAELAGALVALAEQPDVEAIGCTEMSSNGRAVAAATALAQIGWGLARVGDHGEEALAYDATRFRVLQAVERTVSHVRFYTHDGRPRAYFTALFVLLEDLATGETVLVSVGHTPSHAGTRRGFYANLRAKAHRDGLPGWNRELKKLRREWHPSYTVLSMDLNLDVAQAWVRTYLRVSFPSLRLVADRRYVDTHDVRTIDVTLISRSLTPLAWWHGLRVRVMRVTDSDHRSILTRLRHVTRRRPRTR